MDSRLQAFASLARRLAESITSIDDAVDAVAATACDWVGDVAGVLLLEPGSDGFLISAVHDRVDPDVERTWRGRRVSRHAISADVVREQTPFRWHRGQPEDRCEKDGRLRISTGQVVDAVLVAPLWVRGRTIGTLSMARHAPGDPYTDADEDYLQELASLSALAIDNAHLLAATQSALARRDRAEVELQFATDRLMTLFNNTGPVVVTNVAEVIVHANPAAETLLGVSVADLVGRVMDEIAPNVLAASGRPVEHVRPDGTRIFVEHRPCPIIDPTLRAHILVDRTHRVASEVEQRRLLRRLACAEDKERARVARELHDNLGQLLTAASLFAKDLDIAGATPLHDVLDDAMRAVHRLAWTLRPVELAETSLHDALVGLARASRTPTVVEIEPADLLDGLDIDTRAAVYRITQEALTNAARYSEASQITVGARRVGDDAVLEVADDGVGFDIAHVRPDRLGLRVMRERASLVGGELTVSSRPRSGSKVRLAVPLAATSAAAAS
jgi:signal transduction histidine kinase